MKRPDISAPATATGLGLLTLAATLFAAILAGLLLVSALASASPETSGAPVPASASTPAPASALPTVAPNPPAPNFTLDDQDGRAVSLADYTGKIVVLEWTNYDCPFVQRHAKAGTMRELAEKYKAQGIVWLAVNSTKSATREKDRDWIASNRLPYPILEDFNGKVGHAYGALTTPHMFVINAKGRIVYQGAIDDDRRMSGKATVNFVDQALSALTAGKAITVDRTQPYGCSVKYRDQEPAKQTS